MKNIDIHLTAICVTYNRHRLLERALHCFQQQTDKANLLVFDDAGQYVSEERENYVLVSESNRCKTIGEKRSRAVDLARQAFPSTNAVMVWDDDDVYWPHTVEATCNALTKGAWTRPSVVYEPVEQPPKSIKKVRTYNRETPNEKAYGGCWAFRLSAFDRAGGYSKYHICGEDQQLGWKLQKSVGSSIDSICIEYPSPFYMYNRRDPKEHMSEVSQAYRSRQVQDIKKVPKLCPSWNGVDCYKLTIVDEEVVNDRGW